MIQDIAPRFMNVEYKNQYIEDQDYVVIIEASDILVLENKLENVFPRYLDIKEKTMASNDDFMYLFTIDSDPYFLYIGYQSHLLKEGYQRVTRRDLFNIYENIVGFLGYTASHVYDWFVSNRFCGKCGNKMNHRDNERGMHCSSCGMIRYPQISPVVIVAIHDKDKLLLTKYANSEYNRYALVAGFVEIGETLEDAVRREIMEEVGLKVKNITYYGSQPWGITGGLMTGYFAELDGSNKVTLDTDELSEAVWLTKDELPPLLENEKSLTRTMMYQWYKNQSLSR